MSDLFLTHNFSKIGAFIASFAIACQPIVPKLPGPPDPIVSEQLQTEKASKKKSKKRDIRHLQALKTMLNSSFGYRPDRDGQTRFPLPDRKNWTRVRFSMIEHFTGFIYGEDEHSLAVAFIIPLKEKDPSTSAACIQRFEEKARTQVSEMGGRLGETATLMRKWRGKPLVVRTGSGEIDVLFKHYDAALAWTGYPAYQGFCMIYVAVIPWRDDVTPALELRDKWVDSFRKFKPLTESVPYRHE